MIIGVLGPEGTFSEKAAREWNSQAEIRYFEDIPEIIDSILGREVDLGVIPIENSLEGSVGITLDSFLYHNLKIIGEIVIPIRHCLLSKGKLSEIKTILSHPQALAQCRNYIKTHLRGLEVRNTGSTATAAKLASESPELAAIASLESAEKYGLEAIASDIQDREENYTRFAVVGHGFAKATGRDKTSIIVYLKRNRPGALYDLLGEFASRDIDLTKIESRPTKKEMGDYLFYIDMRGHIQDEKIRDALLGIEEKVGMLKVIGSYPSSD